MDPEDLPSPSVASPKEQQPTSSGPHLLLSDGSQTTLQPAENSQTPLKIPKRPSIDVKADASENTSKGKPITSIPSDQLQRQYSPLFFAFLYAALTIFGWIVTCKLSFGPIGVKSYGYDNSANDGYGSIDPIAYHSLFAQSETYFYGARIVNAIIAVLTLPMATAICAKAAVVFVQQSRRDFSLRQTAALADNGWMEPGIWMKLISPRGWSRYGSRLLYLAILLHVLGFMLAPLQQAFLTEHTIKTPTWPIQISDLTDIPDLFTSYQMIVSEDEIVQCLRYALTATNGNEVQSNVWLGNMTNCSSVSNGKVTAEDFDLSCVTTGGTTYAGLEAAQDPFIAQLPAQFNTGLIRQFLPRLNSSVKYDVVNESEFPQECNNMPGAFYAEYSGKGASYENYSIEVCMPGNLKVSPWRATRDRQDITEILYLNATISGFDWPAENSTVFKVQAHSTAGYFELPNYLNGGTTGPLLEKDPNPLCDKHCMAQGRVIYDHNLDENKRKMKRAETGNGTTTSYYSNSSVELDFTISRGPLLMVALALFGESSYIATRTAHPEAYEMTKEQANVTVDSTEGTSTDICYDLFPLVALSRSESGINPFTGLECVELASPGDVESQIARWLSILWTQNAFNADEATNATYQMQVTLTAAVYLANEFWLKQGVQSTSGNLWVTYDSGADTSVPSISMAGIIAISTLLGLFITALFAMATYASCVPTWTSTLDSFAMMRMGAAVADQMPLRVGFNADKVKVLDDTPGWIGDGRPNNVVGRLELAALAGLRNGTEYESYESTTALSNRSVCSRSENAALRTLTGRT